MVGNICFPSTSFKIRQDWWHKLWISALVLIRQRQDDLYDFEASLVYIANCYFKTIDKKMLLI